LRPVAETATPANLIPWWATSAVLRAAVAAISVSSAQVNVNGGWWCPEDTSHAMRTVRQQRVCTRKSSWLARAGSVPCVPA
jgi:hypothetical protein